MIKGFFLVFILFVILIFNFNINVNSYDYQDGIKIYEEQIERLENQRDISIKNLESIYNDSIKRAEQRVLEAKQAYNNMYDIADRQANMAVSRGSNGLVLDEGTKQALYDEVMRKYKDTLDGYKYTVQQAEYNLKIINNQISSELAPKIKQIITDYEIKIQNKEKLIMELIEQEKELLNKKRKIEELNINTKNISSSSKTQYTNKLLNNTKVEEYIPTKKDKELLSKIEILVEKLKKENPKKINTLSSKIGALSKSLKKGTKKYYLINNLKIMLIKDWSEIDLNCDIPDIIIGNQTWAGCNSTIGNGFEYKQDFSYKSNPYVKNIPSNCYHYLSGEKDKTCNRPSNEKENKWDSTYGIDNIWGKIYTGETVVSACKDGYHLPTDEEWTILENTLAGLNCRTGKNRECEGIGWKGHFTKNSSNNLIEALKIPMSGGFFSNEYKSRGSLARLWSSTKVNMSDFLNKEINSKYDKSLYIRHISVESSSITRIPMIIQDGGSVRCIKD